MQNNLQNSKIQRLITNMPVLVLYVGFEDYNSFYN